MPLIQQIKLEAAVDESGQCDYMYGDALRQIGRFREAERLLISAAEQGATTTRFNAMISRAFLLRDKGCFNEAADLLSLIASECDSLPGWFWVVRSSVSSKRELFVESIEFLKRAEFGTDVDEDEVFLNLAYSFRALEQFNEAVLYAKKVIEMDSSLSDQAISIIDSVS